MTNTDILRIVHPKVISNLSAFKSAKQPRTVEVFKHHKHSINTSEEHCSEEWARKRHRTPGYPACYKSFGTNMDHAIFV